MTVLVGVKCTDAVIIGSDSALSSAIGDSLTVEHPGKKIFIIDERIIIAGSGAVGLTQRFTNSVSTLWDAKKLVSKNPIDFSTEISRTVVRDFISTDAPLKDFGGTLVAFPNDHKTELCEFDPKVQPQLRDHNSWHVSLGYGQLVADTLLGLARKAFWGNGPPRKEDGIFVAIWVLSLTIEMCPVGVSGPIQMAVLEKNTETKGKGLVARNLSDDEISCHESQVTSLIEYLGQYKNNLKEQENVAPQTPQTELG